jgi:hypothetical protein
VLISETDPGVRDCRKAPLAPRSEHIPSRAAGRRGDTAARCLRRTRPRQRRRVRGGRRECRASRPAPARTRLVVAALPRRNVPTDHARSGQAGTYERTRIRRRQRTRGDRQTLPLDRHRSNRAHDQRAVHGDPSGQHPNTQLALTGAAPAWSSTSGAVCGLPLWTESSSAASASALLPAGSAGSHGGRPPSCRPRGVPPEFQDCCRPLVAGRAWVLGVPRRSRLRIRVLVGNGEWRGIGGAEL